MTEEFLVIECQNMTETYAQSHSSCAIVTSNKGDNRMGTGQEKQPAVFLIEEDDDTRAVLRDSLTRYGYRVTVAIDEEDALSRVSNGLSADLLLIDVVGKSVEDTLQTGRRIREQAKLDGNTPLIVMAENYAKDLEGTDENAGGNDWILYLGEEPEQLQNLLQRLTASYKHSVSTSQSNYST